MDETRKERQSCKGEKESKGGEGAKNGRKRGGNQQEKRGRKDEIRRDKGKEEGQETSKDNATKTICVFPLLLSLQ